MEECTVGMSKCAIYTTKHTPAIISSQMYSNNKRTAQLPVKKNKYAETMIYYKNIDTGDLLYSTVL